MKWTVRVVAVCFIAAAIVSLGGCEQLAGFFGSLTRKLEDVSIENQSIEVGDIVELVVVGIYSDGTEENISSDLAWESSDPEVVTVTAGTITGVTPGTAIVTVTYYGRETLSDTAVITVATAGVDEQIIYDCESDQTGAWLTIDDGVGSDITLWERSMDTAFSPDYSMKGVYNVVADPASWGAGVQFTIPAGPIDLSDRTGMAIQLQPNGVAGSVQLGLSDSDGTFLGTGAIADNAIEFSGTGWIRIAAPFSDMGIAPWAEGSVAGFNYAAVEMLSIVFETGSGTLYVDDLSAYQ